MDAIVADTSGILKTGSPDAYEVAPRGTVSEGIRHDVSSRGGVLTSAGAPRYTPGYLQLREADAGAVAIGTAATLEFTSYPGRLFAGRVTYIYPVLTEQSRTVRARIAVANPGALLKPGMYATVRLSTSGQSALSVPRSAVVQTGERALVFLDVGEGKLMQHTVQLGRAGSDYIEILSGVKAGQRVVTSAQFLIDSESNLGEVMKAMAGMGNPMPPGAAPVGEEAKDMSAKGADMRNMPGMSPTPKR